VKNFVEGLSTYAISSALGSTNPGLRPPSFLESIMRKTLFFCNLVSSTVMLTMAFVMWLAPESFAMATSHFHVIMTVVGTMGMTWSVLEMRDMHHADDLFENSEVVE
jgi:FtsH-binding integral membrane protein